MLRYLAKKPSLGIEITATALRMAAVSVRRTGLCVEHAKTADLPDGTVCGNYSSPNILDREGLAGLFRECLAGVSRPYQRAALSLPDGVFRVQTLDFDELPAKRSEWERLIRWRLEKAAAFDLSDAVLRFQVLRRQENGFTVMVCAARRPVLAQYESLLRELGLEPWSVGISSFHILNLYLPVMAKKSPVFALARLTEDSFTTIVTEAGGARFYRYKEVRRGGADGIKARFIREIEDSLHFYAHMSRAQTQEVRHLYLAGESTMLYELADGLSTATSLAVEVLTPADVIAGNGKTGPATAWLAVMAAALGAGSEL